MGFASLIWAIPDLGFEKDSVLHFSTRNEKKLQKGSNLPSSTEFPPNLCYLAIYLHLEAHILMSLADLKLWQFRRYLLSGTISLFQMATFLLRTSWSYSVRFWVQLGHVYSLSHPGKVVILQGYFLMEGVNCTHIELFAICLESKLI